MDAMVQGMSSYCAFIREMAKAIGLPVDTTPCDDRGAVQSATITGFIRHTRHVNMKLKCSRKYIDDKAFITQYAPTSEPRADILAKRVGKSSVFNFVNSVLAR